MQGLSTEKGTKEEAGSRVEPEEDLRLICIAVQEPGPYFVAFDDDDENSDEP